MNEQIAHAVGPDRIDLAWESFGSPQAPPVLLLMGLGQQMLGWPEGLCEALAARGLRPIRIDNRDVGRSSHLQSRGLPDMPAIMAGDHGSVAYRLEDMAADVTGLLDALGIEAAHVVGASMGGQIAQILASDHPQRVRSLVSMMSWPGGTQSGQPVGSVMAQLFALPTPGTREESMEQAVQVQRLVGSPGFALDEASVRERAGRAWDRAGYDLGGLMRQAAAAVASGDRTARLGAVTAPTLVIHGTDDVLCDASGGRATAAAIPGARLEMIEGMGHNLPAGVWPRLVELIAAHVQDAETRMAE